MIDVSKSHTTQEMFASPLNSVHPRTAQSWSAVSSDTDFHGAQFNAFSAALNWVITNGKRGWRRALQARSVRSAGWCEDVENLGEGAVPRGGSGGAGLNKPLESGAFRIVCQQERGVQRRHRRAVVRHRVLRSPAARGVPRQRARCATHFPLRTVSVPGVTVDSGPVCVPHEYAVAAPVEVNRFPPARFVNWYDVSTAPTNGDGPDSTTVTFCRRRSVSAIRARAPRFTAASRRAATHRAHDRVHPHRRPRRARLAVDGQREAAAPAGRDVWAGGGDVLPHAVHVHHVRHCRNEGHRAAQHIDVSRRAQKPAHRSRAGECKPAAQPSERKQGGASKAAQARQRAA